MKTKDEFLEDLEILYDFLEKQNKKRSEFYSCFENKSEKRDLIDNFLIENNLKINEESRFAIASKFVSLKNDSFIQFLNKENIKEELEEKLSLKLYTYVSKFYGNEFENLINFSENEKLFSEFYLEILKGVFNVGLEMNNWFPVWKNYIINTINKELKNKFENDDEIFEFLEKENLFDLGHFNLKADRSYSALIKNDKNNSYISKSYSCVFKNEVNKIVLKLNEFKNNLLKFEDNIYNQKQEYLNYLDVLIEAFRETNVDKLVLKWSKVDEKWMKITTPFQIGHPLEYYDDNFRKAVQLDWDLRIINPKFAKNLRVLKIKKMYEKLFYEFNGDMEIYEKSLDNLNRVQLYLGRLAIYSGSELNGLFSAQVVPNDMVISKKFGKKIFAFADLVLENQRQKPLMKLPKIIFEDSLVKEMRHFVFNETKKWHKVYDISTIGHEYGHILWLDDDTEIYMNKKGNFKNIEEFKATTGGLVSFFLDDSQEDLKREVLMEHILRSVNLIAWKKVSEVEPYYCEGLIHLKGLFETKIIKFENEKLKVNFNDETYDKIKNWYLKTYEKLAKSYLEKKDANEFLFEFAKKENRFFMPIDKNLFEFVNFYYKNYEKYSNVLDDEDKVENYLKK